MSMTGRFSSAVVAEGKIDTLVVKKIFIETDIKLRVSYSCQGKPDFKRKIKNYNNAAQHLPFFALCDLDRDECAPSTRSEMLSNISSLMCFRIAVRAIEAWLMADREAFAESFSVVQARIPREPDIIDNPKTELINIARKSGRAKIREGIPPSPEGGRRVGSEYTIIMTEFINSHWSPKRACKNSDSLASAWRRCERFAETGSWY